MPRKMYRHSRRPASRIVRGESRTHKLHEQNRTRIGMLMIIIGVSYVMLAGRLIEVSVIGGGELPFKRLVSEPQLLLHQQEQDHATAEAPAVSPYMLRRSIVDRHGMMLAGNVPTASLAANPSIIREPEKAAKQLAAILADVSEAEIIAKLSNEKARFAYIKRHLTPSEQAKIHALGIPGLFFENEVRRVYPMAESAAHVLGYVDTDNKGIAGVERYFDKRLLYTLQEEGPLALSIDMRVQSIMVKELQETMETFKAEGAAGIMVDVRSGEVLSMASLPSFDPHDPMRSAAETRFNRISLGAYELGSSFKTFTLALALDKRVIKAADGYDTSYPIHEAGHTINDDKPYYRWLSVPEIFAFSSNIGTVKMLQDVGFKAQRSFIEKLGLTKPIAIELPERARPIVPRDWQPVTHMTVSYGHGISVSPLHLVRAMSAMVNGGVLPELTLLKQPPAAEPTGERVIRAQTSRQVRDMMRLVVDYGTARKAQVEGYRVGGKTGTAEKIINGRYHDDKKIVSFVSAFPIDNPRYLMFIMVDEPHPTKETFGYATGGWVAAPATSRIIEKVGPMLGVMPEFTQPNIREAAFWDESRRRNDEARQAFHRRRSGGVHAASY